MHYLISLVIFVTVFLLVLSVYLLWEDRKLREKRKLLIRLSPKTEKGDLRLLMDSRTEGAFEKRLGRFVDLRPLTQLLEEADVLMSVGRLLAYCTALGLGAFLVVGIALGSVIAMILALLAGIVAPVGYLIIRRNKRETALVSQLPDAVDMISRALRAGQGLDAALQEVARSFSDPVGAELKRIYEEMAMGLSFESAVRGFERRFHRVTDVRMLCAALLIQRETGGNLTTILDNISHTIRERFTFFRQVRALSAEGRLSAMILGAMPILFCLIIWVIRPEHVRLLFTNPAGKKLVMLAMVLEITGFLVMFRMAKVKA